MTNPEKNTRVIIPNQKSLLSTVLFGFNGKSYREAVSSLGDIPDEEPVSITISLRRLQSLAAKYIAMHSLLSEKTTLPETQILSNVKSIFASEYAFESRKHIQNCFEELSKEYKSLTELRSQLVLETIPSTFSPAPHIHYLLLQEKLEVKETDKTPKEVSDTCYRYLESLTKISAEGANVRIPFLSTDEAYVVFYKNKHIEYFYKNITQPQLQSLLEIYETIKISCSYISQLAALKDKLLKMSEGEYFYKTGSELKESFDTFRRHVIELYAPTFTISVLDSKETLEVEQPIPLTPKKIMEEGILSHIRGKIKPNQNNTIRLSIQLTTEDSNTLLGIGPPHNPS